jgi:VCBS repeat
MRQPTATEDGDTVIGAITVMDVDAGDAVTFAPDGEIPAGLIGNPDGSYSFDPSDAAYQDLAAGETREVSAGFIATDEAGASDAGTLAITVTGVNDAPVAEDAEATATEDGDAVTGTLTASDVDTGDAVTFSADGALPAGLTLDADGSYSFDPSDAAYQDLAAGETREVTAGFIATDEAGASDAGTLAITVTGVNDAPVAEDAEATATEDGDAVTGTLTASDVDTGDAVTFSADGALPAGLTLDADGSYSFDPSDAA